MIQHYPMARATSLLGGPPVVYDLTKLSVLTAATPTFQRLSRRLETVSRNQKEKRFGVRPMVDLRFQVPHSATRNALARYYELSDNQLLNPDDYIVGPSFEGWQGNNVTATEDDTYAPDGTHTAWKMAATGSQPNFEQRANAAGSLRSHNSKTAIFSVFLRADTPHDGIIDVRANASPDDQVSQTIFLSQTWKRYSLRNTFDPVTLAGNLRSSWGFIFPIASGSSGDCHFWRADLREISAIPGTDEEILADLASKFDSDDWSVEITLDSLTWREMFIDDYQKAPLADKWVGHDIQFVLSAAKAIPGHPAILDGSW